MAYTERKKLISELEKVRSSRIISYFLSDRETFPPGIPGFSAQLTGEPHLFLFDQLRTIGKTKHLELFLYTRGGSIDSVWPLVSILREYCEKLAVIVPFRAHSGGTLICLGADEVVMTELAELSPIDPTTGNQFNPSDPTNPQNRYGISVEDVSAYFSLSEKRVGITEKPHKLEVLKELTCKVHPLALGNVERVYLQIRRLARSLLELHLDKNENDKKINEIIKALTEEFYSHTHFINRKEAMKLLGNWVKTPTDEENQIIMDLFNSYTETLQLRNKFNVPEYLGEEQTRKLNVVSALIDSTVLSHSHTTELNLMQRPNIPSNIQIQLPPGQPLPLAPWVGRTYEWGIQKMGWAVNEGGI